MSIIKLLWFFLFILILFFRYTIFSKIIILILTIIITLITIIKIIADRNEWRIIAEEYHKKNEIKNDK